MTTSRAEIENAISAALIDRGITPPRFNVVSFVAVHEADSSNNVIMATIETERPIPADCLPYRVGEFYLTRLSQRPIPCLHGLALAVTARLPRKMPARLCAVNKWLRRGPFKIYMGAL